MPFGQVDIALAAILFEELLKGGVSDRRFELLLEQTLLQTAVHLSIEVVETFGEILRYDGQYEHSAEEFPALLLCETLQLLLDL